MAGNQGPGEDPNPELLGYQQREVVHAAAQQDLTPEEYGLYRGRYPGSKTPVQCATAFFSWRSFRIQ